jgi:hypothetical protein
MSSAFDPNCSWNNQQCHKQFDDDPDDPDGIWHSQGVRSTEPLVMSYLQYLQWLREQFDSNYLCLILYHFGPGFCEGFTTLAEELGIRVIWIPNGATGTD